MTADEYRRKAAHASREAARCERKIKAWTSPLAVSILTQAARNWRDTAKGWRALAKAAEKSRK